MAYSEIISMNCICNVCLHILKLYRLTFQINKLLPIVAHAIVSVLLKYLARHQSFQINALQLHVG